MSRQSAGLYTKPHISSHGDASEAANTCNLQSMRRQIALSSQLNHCGRCHTDLQSLEADVRETNTAAVGALKAEIPCCLSSTH